MPSFVQQVSNYSGYGPSSVVLPAFSASTAAGSAIWVVVDVEDGTSPGTPTDTLGNTYTLIGSCSLGAGNPTLSHFYALNPTGGACTITVPTPLLVAAGTYCAAYAAEVSGATSLVAHSELHSNDGIGPNVPTAGSATVTGSGTGLIMAFNHNINGYTDAAGTSPIAFTAPTPVWLGFLGGTTANGMPEWAALASMTGQSVTATAEDTHYNQHNMVMAVFGGPQPPTIVTNPAPQSAIDGDLVTFSVSASSTGTITGYQWKFRGSNVGSSSSSYTRQVQRSDNGGLITVDVTDTNGTTTSAPVALLVTLPVRPRARRRLPSTADYTLAQWFDRSLGAGLFDRDFYLASGGGGGSITGAAALLDASDTMSSAIVIPIAGTFIKTDANDTMSSAVATTTAAAFAKTDANDTLASAGVLPIVAAAALTDAADTMAATVGTSQLAFAASTTHNTTISLPTTVGFKLTPTVAGINDQSGGISISYSTSGTAPADATSDTLPGLTYTGATSPTSGTSTTGLATAFNSTTSSGIFGVAIASGYTYTIYVPLTVYNAITTLTASLADGSAPPVVRTEDSVATASINKIVSFTLTAQTATTLNIAIIQASNYSGGGNTHLMGVYVTRVSLAPTASLAVVDSNDMLSATATLPEAAAAALTDSPDTLASAGVLPIVASLAKTDANDTLASAATLAEAASSALTDAPDTLSAAGTVQIAATSALQDSADTLVATGTLTGGLTASSALTDAGDTMSAAVVLPEVASASLVDAPNTLVATAVLSESAAAALVDAPDTLSSIGTLSNMLTAAAALVDAPDALVASVLEAITAAAALQDAGDTLSSSAFIGAPIIASASLVDAPDHLVASAMRLVFGRPVAFIGLPDNVGSVSSGNTRTSVGGGGNKASV